jgi:hypothetical protein
VKRATRVRKKTKVDILLKEWAVVSVDESIFVYETLIRALWALKGSKPRALITGPTERPFYLEPYPWMDAKCFVNISK